MSETRRFHLGDVLTVTTGRFLCPEGVGGLYKILNWMTGESLMTHQLIRAGEECREPLLAQHPDLAYVDVPDDLEGEEAVRRWLAGEVDFYGEYRDVTPLHEDDHTRIDPITEMRKLAPNAEIIVVSGEAE